MIAAIMLIVLAQAGTYLSFQGCSSTSEGRFTFTRGSLVGIRTSFADDGGDDGTDADATGRLCFQSF